MWGKRGEEPLYGLSDVIVPWEEGAFPLAGMSHVTSWHLRESVWKIYKVDIFTQIGLFSLLFAMLLDLQYLI